jgi:hypothetical protein
MFYHVLQFIGLAFILAVIGAAVIGSALAARNFWYGMSRDMQRQFLEACRIGAFGPAFYREREDPYMRRR